MNRKAFLASVAAMIAAPFMLKAEPNPKQELEAWIKANPELYNLIILKSIESKMKAAGGHSLKISGEFRVKGEDMVYVIKR